MIHLLTIRHLSSVIRCGGRAAHGVSTVLSKEGRTTHPHVQRVRVRAYPLKHVVVRRSAIHSLLANLEMNPESYLEEFNIVHSMRWSQPSLSSV
jgi:hypothetical protein